MTYSGYGKYMQLKPQVLFGTVTRANGLRLAKIAKAVCLRRETLHKEAFKSGLGKFVINVTHTIVIRQKGTHSVHLPLFLPTLPITEKSQDTIFRRGIPDVFNPLSPELNPICFLLALLAHDFLDVSRITVKSLTLRLLMSYIYGAPILDVSGSHTTTQHSR
jgi:hypothetical protein